MGNDDSDESELETFNLELTPWQMYSLNTILRYNMVEMDDPIYSTASQVLAKEVNDTIASEQFIDAMAEQRDAIDQKEEKVRQQMNQTNSMGMGVQ